MKAKVLSVTYSEEDQKFVSLWMAAGTGGGSGRVELAISAAEAIWLQPRIGQTIDVICADPREDD